jgi:hypothetical protein
MKGRAKGSETPIADRAHVPSCIDAQNLQLLNLTKENLENEN